MHLSLTLIKVYYNFLFCDITVKLTLQISDEYRNRKTNSFNSCSNIRPQENGRIWQRSYSSDTKKNHSLLI